MTLARIPEIVVLSADGDLRRGGWIYSASVRGDTDMVQAGDFLQYRAKSHAGFVDSAFRFAAEGYVMATPDFTFDRHSSSANIQFGTADNLLTGSLQALSATVVASPDNSHQFTSFQFADVVEHILRSHCNFVYADPPGANGAAEGIIFTMDYDTGSIEFTTVGDRFIVNKSENIWSTLQQIGGGEEGGGEFHRPWFDRRGVFHYQPATPFISPQPTSRGTITKDHIIGPIQVRYISGRFDQKIGQVEMVSGIRPDTIFNSKYPASPGQGRILQKTSGVWSKDQTQANTHAERLYKWINRSYSLTIPLDPGLVFFGEDGFGLDLADRILLTYNGPAEDALTGAGVHLNLSAQSMYVYNIQASFDQARSTGVANVTLELDIA